MRGFPIVSIGTITSNGTFADGVVSNSFIVAPQFELDEYFGSKNNLDSYYRNIQYAKFSSYIESITVYPNNLEATSGVMNRTLESQGFRQVESYSVLAKVNNVKNVRFDSFYVYQLDAMLFTLGRAPDKTLSLERIEINVPNATVIKNNFNLNLAYYINSVYFNIPKVVEIWSAFLYRDKEIKNLYFNAEKLTIGRGQYFYEWHKQNTNVLATVSSVNVFNILKTYKDPMSNVNLINAGTCSLEEFDIRYWDLWQNTTGKDSGLH